MHKDTAKYQELNESIYVKPYMIRILVSAYQLGNVQFLQDLFQEKISN